MTRNPWPFLLLALLTPTAPLAGQESRTATVRGVVIAGESGRGLHGAVVEIEGTRLATVTDSAGRFTLNGVPPGTHTLRASMLGFASARVPLTLRAGELVVRQVALAVSALRMDAMTVTADAMGRAYGETGTATVIDAAAIANQSATSVLGILELVPGSVLTPPGLDRPQQFTLRSAAAAGFGTGATMGGQRSAADLASFGTSIILDGVPLSNNANLQTLGPRAEVLLPGTAGAGIDLRRIPATTLERVEVIRGLPSVRYGDLTQGAVVIYTRAGEVAPEVALQIDPRTGAAAGLGGTRFAVGQAATATFDAARTRIAPGETDDVGWRMATQLAHRYESAAHGGGGAAARVVSDTRADLFQLVEDRPVRDERQPTASSSRDRGLRLSNRTRYQLDERTELSLTGSAAYTRQSSFRQNNAGRAAMPFTDRLTEGRQEGYYVIGTYLARVEVDGAPWQLYGRTELTTLRELAGVENHVRAGLELRREWNSGPGVQFDIERPPQSRFNAIDGFDRPRRYDDVPPLVASAVYVDDRATLWLGQLPLELQAGIRADLLHRGSTWLSGTRDLVLQPRLQAQLTVFDWLRLRAAAGRTAKLPTLADLFPAPQYFDVINVNYYANDPADRLAVLTTFIRDPTNTSLGMARADKLEAGFDLLLGPGAGVSFVAFSDRTRGAVGTDFERQFLIRERFGVSDTPGDGRTAVIDPDDVVHDTIPILIHRPSNMLELSSGGAELTAVLPEIRALRTRLEVQAALTRTELIGDGLDYGSPSMWTEFQLTPARTRAPYWEPARRHGTQAVVTSRAVYREPAIGLAVTGTLQHYVRDERRLDAGTDTLAFAGYVTRTGELVPIPPEQRAEAQYSDLRRTRTGMLSMRAMTQPDWIFNLQVAKTLPGEGRLSFYAFNAFDREGRRADDRHGPRQHIGARFGLDVRLPVPYIR